MKRREFVTHLAATGGAITLSVGCGRRITENFEDQKASGQLSPSGPDNNYLIDPAITRSYLRDLQWARDTPAANDRRREERFEKIRKRSLVAKIIQAGHAKVEVGLAPENDHVLVWCRILSLDGEWPGGDYVLQSLRLVFETDSIGERIEPELMGRDIPGFKAYKQLGLRGYFFPRLPLVRQLPLLPGEYDVSISIRGTFARTSSENQKIGIGKVRIPEGLSWPAYGPTNGLMVHWADYDLYSDCPDLPRPTNIKVPGWLEPDFAALDEAIEYVRRWHQCPLETSGGSRSPAEGHSWNSRYLGFYLGAFVPAYRLTGEPRYFQMCEYLYNTILNNIYPASWGGPVVMQHMGTQPNLLYHGIIARSVLEFAKMMNKPELARPMYDIYAAWPRDPQHDGRLIHVASPEEQEQTELKKPFNYNQVMSSMAAIWPLGKFFEDEELQRTAENVWNETMQPGMQPGGWWFYTEGGKFVTQHYDMVMKYDASTWLKYPRWAEDSDFRRVMCQSADYAINRYTTRVEDMLVWQAYSAGGGWGDASAVCKAGMAILLFTRLYEAGFEQYAEPIRQSARFIERMRKRPELRRIWYGSWTSEHVILPLLEATLAGVFNE
jgi:hypothetical protein